MKRGIRDTLSSYFTLRLIFDADKQKKAISFVKTGPLEFFSFHDRGAWPVCPLPRPMVLMISIVLFFFFGCSICS